MSRYFLKDIAKEIADMKNQVKANAFAVKMTLASNPVLSSNITVSRQRLPSAGM
jgi:hypothetical protein